MMDMKKLEEGIGRTGFHLEQQVASTLRKAGWSVISNRYYVDDQENAVREMDMVAYQVKDVLGLQVYTTLIISCKKSDKNVWALLSRDRERDDPNVDWSPTHIWSNDRALAFATSQSSWPEQYYARTRELGVQRVSSEPEVDIFAYKEMNRESGAPQNDKPIFASVTSLMKAQSYEIEALPQRKKTPSIYQFNLIAVVDADLVRAHFDGARVVASEIVDELYVARYLIKRRETSARIHFVNVDEFAKLLKDYRRLHLANALVFREARDVFYKDILSDRQRIAVFESDFSAAVLGPINSRLRQSTKKFAEIDSISASFDKQSNTASVLIDALDGAEEYLEADLHARRWVASALKKIYRYEGPFRFAWNVPF